MKSITSYKKLILVAFAVLIIALNVSVAYAQGTEDDIGGIIASLFSSPSLLITFVIELALGFGLGYFSLKAFKYILGLIGIFVVGVLLNVWASPELGSSITTYLTKLGLSWSKVRPVIMSVVTILGLTTVLPVTIGFVIGLVVAMMK